MSFVQGASSSGPSGPAATRCVNVQEAKTHLSALLARVAAGERSVLSRHGKPIAQLVPLGRIRQAAELIHRRCRDAAAAPSRPPRNPQISVLNLKAGDRTRTGDVQLGKLTFYH